MPKDITNIENNHLTPALKSRLLQALEPTDKPQSKKKQRKNPPSIPMVEIKQLLEKMKTDAIKLQSILITKEDRKELQLAVDFLEARIHNTMKATLGNLEFYQKEGWKKLIKEEKEQE